jgi:hypothetical protein
MNLVLATINPRGGGYDLILVIRTTIQSRSKTGARPLPGGEFPSPVHLGQQGKERRWRQKNQMKERGGTDPHSCPGLDRRKTCTHSLCGAKLHTACILQQHVQEIKERGGDVCCSKLGAEPSSFGQFFDQTLEKEKEEQL